MLLAGVKQLLKKIMNSKLSIAKNAYYFLEKECKRIAFFVIALILSYVKSRTIRNLLWLLNKRRNLFLVFTSVITLTSILECIGIGSLYPIIGVFENETKKIAYIEYFNNWLPFTLGEDGFLLFLFVGVAVVILVKGVFLIGSFYIQYRLSETLKYNWQTQIFRNYLDQEYEYFVRHQTGDLIQRQMVHTETAGTAILFSCEMIRDFIIALFLYVMLCFISIKATLIVTIVMVVLFLISLAFSKLKIYVTSQEHARLQKHAYSVAVEAITGIRQIKAFLAEDFFEKIFSDTLKKKIKIYIVNATFGQSPGAITQTIAMSGIILVLYFTIRHSDSTKGLMPLISVFGGGVYKILSALSVINNKIMNMGQALPSVNIVSDLLALDSNPVKLPEIGRFKERICFEDVTFSYSKSKFHLSKINLTFEKGKFYGIVGPSGSGKSTLADLIIHFYSPQKGAILADNKNLRDVDVRSWRKQIGFISQDTFIFNGTIEENISFAEDVTISDRNKVVTSAQIADIDEFIRRLPNGYQTEVGERGVKLSGGQRQRLAIARAVYRDPEIYIFDEATSSLDTISEKNIQKAIEGIAQTKTVIAITHRLSAVMNADEIFVLNNGRIVEKGTHLELLRRKGFYNELYANQTGQGIANEANPVSA